MSVISIVALGMAMSTDAFAAALAKGACMPRPRLSQALCVGLTFGIIEAITPLIGWLLGSVASRFIASIDHWVAFGLLVGLGIHMIWKSFQPVETECEEPTGVEEGAMEGQEKAFEGAVMAGNGVSMANAVGSLPARRETVMGMGAVAGMPSDHGGQGASRRRVTRLAGLLPAGMLSMLMTSVATSIDAMAVGVTLAFVDVPIGQVALVIGLCTTVMVTIGVMLGRLLGTLVGRRAEMLGGIVLIVIGAVILYEHLAEGPALALLRSGTLG